MGAQANFGISVKRRFREALEGGASSSSEFRNLELRYRSGIGKSSVVNELHKMLVPPRGLFASGKFDQNKPDIPYSTLAQASQSLVRPLLGKDQAELGSWCHTHQEALGPNGGLVVDLVPELKLITALIGRGMSR